MISLVIPMLDEADGLPSLLEHLRSFRNRGCEVLLVDGGSSDGSAELAEQAGFCVLRAPRGRAQQMNAGAHAAHGDILLFLHADTRLPANADTLITAALSGGSRVWGRFDVAIAGSAPMLRVVAFLMNRRSRWTGIATGDQAIFVRRVAFDAIGGFPDQALMEDLEASRRLKRISPPACLAARAVTSGRRWERNGVWRTILLMWRLRLAYRLGAPAETLARQYRPGGTH
ncbi:family 2 glycosyl transferase [Burkholderiales bacterium GJ-E10]|nr:family 2 glycosyl transferase [Burkholderiales bacterium GJ-E10]